MLWFPLSLVTVLVSVSFVDTVKPVLRDHLKEDN